MLEKALAMRGNMEGESEINLDKIPGLAVLKEDDVRRTYQAANSSTALNVI